MKRLLLSYLVVVVTGLLLVSLASAVWATPSQEPLRQPTPIPRVPPPTPVPGSGEVVSEVGISPEEGRTFSSVRGDLMVAIPPGSLEEIAGVQLRSQTVEEAPRLPADFNLLGHVFSLWAYKQLTSVHVPEFDGPVGICIYYSDEDVANAGGDPNSLVVVSYDDPMDKWAELDTTIDTVAGSACAEITHPTFFALAISVGSGLPVVRIAIIALATVLVLAVVGFYLWGARR